MKALRFLASRWVLSFVGVVILALLVWFFGPLLPLLEGWVARLVVIPRADVSVEGSHF